jgi:hypothetical protein
MCVCTFCNSKQEWKALDATDSVIRAKSVIITNFELLFSFAPPPVQQQ